MALLVTLEERWLADVGFGDSSIEPLPLGGRGEQAHGVRAYRIDEDGGRLVLIRRDDGGKWAAQYRFGLGAHAYADYAGMCRHRQTSPGSHFTRGRVCSRLTAEGAGDVKRGTRLITTSGDERQEREPAGEGEFAAALRERFAVVMP
jgi:N-hydroxyarylamine O-acetyltransferase